MAHEIALKYGCNPNQKPARIFMEEGELPVTVLNGRPGLYQFSGCAERLAARSRAEAGDRNRGGDVV